MRTLHRIAGHVDAATKAGALLAGPGISAMNKVEGTAPPRAIAATDDKASAFAVAFADDIWVMPERFEGKGMCSYCGKMRPMAARLRVTEPCAAGGAAPVATGTRMEAVACARCYENTEQLFDRFYAVARLVGWVGGKTKI
jgi:hypothetical protein